MASELMRIVLIDSNERVLKSFSEKSSANAERYLKQLHVELMLNKRVMSGDEDHITLDDGSALDTNTVIWAAGVKGVTLPGLEAGLHERAGRYIVDRFSAIHGFNDVYALGDIALMEEPAYPRGHPQVATVAIQQGRHLAHTSCAPWRRRPWCPSAIVTRGAWP